MCKNSVIHHRLDAQHHQLHVRRVKVRLRGITDQSRNEVSPKYSVPPLPRAQLVSYKPQFQPQIQPIQPQLPVQMQPQMQTQMQHHVQPQMQLQPQMQPQMHSAMQTQSTEQMSHQLQPPLNTVHVATVQPAVATPVGSMPVSSYVQCGTVMSAAAPKAPGMLLQAPSLLQPTLSLLPGLVPLSVAPPPWPSC